MSNALDSYNEHYAKLRGETPTIPVGKAFLRNVDKSYSGVAALYSYRFGDVAIVAPSMDVLLDYIEFYSIDVIEHGKCQRVRISSDEKGLNR